MEQRNRTTVIFVRHARSRYGEDDRIRPLTEEGMKDREIVLELLKNRHIDCFMSSPYRRSIDTIQPAADHLGMKIITEERFRERTVGTWSGDWLEKRWADFTAAEEGGECLLSVQNRNIDALKDVLTKYEGKTVVIGTHGTALSTILNYYNKDFGLNDFLRIVSWMPYVVELVFEGDRLIYKNELGHIEKTIEN